MTTAAIPAEKLKGFSEVLYLLYAASTDFEKWPYFLEALAAYFDAFGAHFLYFDVGNSQLQFNIMHGVKITPELERKFEELIMEHPGSRYSLERPGTPMSCRLIFSDEEIRSSRFYKEISRPMDSEYNLGVLLPGDQPGVTASINLYRGIASTHFTQGEVDLMGEFIPHIKQAVGLQAKFANLDFSQRAAQAALDRVRIGIVLVDEFGKIKFANQVAREIAGAGDGISIINDQVRIENANGNARVLQHVGDSVRSARQGEILGSDVVAVARPSGGPDYEVLVSTLWGNHLRFGLGKLDDPIAVLFLTDPERPQEAPAELLQRLYGLTAVEAAVLERLVAGESLKAAVPELGITYNTARQHVKSIFTKTDTARQSDLIRLVLSSPIWLHEKARSTGTTTTTQRLPARA